MERIVDSISPHHTTAEAIRDENSQFLLYIYDCVPGTWNSTRDAPICTCATDSQRNKRKKELTKRKIICSEMENVDACLAKEFGNSMHNKSTLTLSHMETERESTADSRSNYTYFVLRLYRRANARRNIRTEQPADTLHFYAVFHAWVGVERTKEMEPSTQYPTSETCKCVAASWTERSRSRSSKQISRTKSNDSEKKLKECAFLLCVALSGRPDGWGLSVESERKKNERNAVR